MAVQITDENFAQYLSQYTYTVEEHGGDVITDVSEIGDDTVLPGIEVQNGVMTGYIRMSLGVLKAYATNFVSATQSIWNSWFGTNSSTGVQGEWADLKADIQSELNDSAAATTGAEQVNATLEGTTITVTDRNGDSNSVNFATIGNGFLQSISEEDFNYIFT